MNPSQQNFEIMYEKCPWDKLNAIPYYQSKFKCSPLLDYIGNDIDMTNRNCILLPQI